MISLKSNIPSGADQILIAAVNSIYEDLRKMQRSAHYFPPKTSTTLPPAADNGNWWTAYYCTDTDKPAICDGDTPAWRYFDGSLV